MLLNSSSSFFFLLLLLALITETAEAAVAEAGVDLNFFELLELEAHLVQGLLAHVLDAQVDHGVGQRPAHVKLHRQVVHAVVDKKEKKRGGVR